MDRVILGEDGRCIPWAERIIGVRFAPDAKAIGWGDDRFLRGVTVFDRFSECDLNMHCASDGTRAWLRRPMLHASFAYPFVQLWMRRVTVMVASKNAASLRFTRHLGFEVEGLCRHATPDDDIVVLGMLREHCRFIPAELRM